MIEARAHEFARQRVKYLVEQGGAADQAGAAIKQPAVKRAITVARVLGVLLVMIVCLWVDNPFPR